MRIVRDLGWFRLVLWRRLGLDRRDRLRRVVLLHLLLVCLFPPTSEFVLLRFDFAGGVRQSGQIPVNRFKLEQRFVYRLGPVEVGTRDRRVVYLACLVNLPPSPAVSVRGAV